MGPLAYSGRDPCYKLTFIIISIDCDKHTKPLNALACASSLVVIHDSALRTRLISEISTNVWNVSLSTNTAHRHTEILHAQTNTDAWRNARKSCTRCTCSLLRYNCETGIIQYRKSLYSYKTNAHARHVLRTSGLQIDKYQQTHCRKYLYYNLETAPVGNILC